MANTVESENEVKLQRGIQIIRDMINISASRLEGLRTRCSSSAELTQQEIRTLETKLVKMYSELLINKSKLPESFPTIPAKDEEIEQWLRIVGAFINY